MIKYLLSKNYLSSFCSLKNKRGLKYSKKKKIKDDNKINKYKKAILNLKKIINKQIIKLKSSIEF